MKKLKMILVITILGLSIIPFGNSNANTVTGCSYKFVMAPYRPLTQCLKPVGPRFSGGYLVYGGFEVLFTDSEYKCYYFEASGEIMLHGCTLCRKTYISQSFQDIKGNLYTMFSNAECPLSPTGYHDGRSMSEVYPCVCNPDIYVH
ncbi:MAG: hypothetical protein WCM76_00020 [Bacteroidota bacterium]